WGGLPSVETSVVILPRQGRWGRHGTLTADVSVPDDDPRRRRELPEPHGAAGVELLGGDADLGAQPELAAVGEPGRGVDDERRGVDLAGEALGRAQVGGADGLGVAAGPPADVLDRRVEVLDDADGEVEAEVLGGPVLVG